ncbi:TrmH family RNA methyltransferase [Desulfonatronovibrio hydrogenovorans]|uniref:TrmH family RNA methyltransferase n=1 Tax=Desulfonatronovibrio hydrogenovorans TaxID=53245 RepID=UPI0005525B61|nr:RNA methyltransferase [Desulfonatronovibrio hydrogenovorans]
MTSKIRTSQRVERVRKVLGQRQKDLTLVINNIHDPHNVSAILRSCDAFGVAAVHLLYTRNTFPVLGKKSSASAKKWVERVNHPCVPSLVESLSSQGMNLIRTGFSKTAIAVHEWDFTRPTAVVLGNEHSGVEKDLQKVVDQEIYIPMLGMVQSLNVSVAAAIILYEAYRQRNRVGFNSGSYFSQEELEDLFQKWIEK